jgi:hypothetical protein
MEVFAPQTSGAEKFLSTEIDASVPETVAHPTLIAPT